MSSTFSQLFFDSLLWLSANYNKVDDRAVVCVDAGTVFTAKEAHRGAKRSSFKSLNKQKGFAKTRARFREPSSLFVMQIEESFKALES